MANRDFRSRLKRLFSNGTVVVRLPDGKRKIFDTDEIQMRSKSEFRRRFSAIHRGQMSTVHGQSMAFQTNRRQLLMDYDAMDADAVISSALDLYADEAVVSNEFGETLSITCKDENVREILENLFYDILNIEHNLWSWFRTMVKYGDFFLHINVEEDLGITSAMPLSAYDIVREEGFNPERPNDVQFLYDSVMSGGLGGGSKNAPIHNFEMAHFRLLSDANFIPYGKSILENARRVWKQLCLTENTNIWTSNGFKKIKNVNVGDIVYSYDYDNNILIPASVKNHMFTGNRQCYEIKTAHRTITGTAEHPILVANGQYKTIGELTTDDYIVIGNHMTPAIDKLPNLVVNDIDVKAKFNDEYFESIESDYQVCLECGNEYGRLTGLHLNTHSLTRDEYFEKFDINSSFTALMNRNCRIDSNLAEKYCHMMGYDVDQLEYFLPSSIDKIIPESILVENLSMFVRFFGFMLGDGWIDDNTVSFSLGNRLDKSMKYVEFLNKIGSSYSISNEGSTAAYCRVYSKYFRLLLEQLQFKTGTLNKIVPNWVFELPIELKREFLFGFADADGCLVGNRFTVSGINDEMLESLHVLAQQSGFTTTNFGKNNSDVFGFSFGTSTYHQKVDINGVVIEKVRCINDVGIHPVYDIEVDNDIHNFVADGVIAHNCLMEDAMLIHRIMRAPEKRVYSIDVGNLNPADVDGYIKKIQAQIKKVPYIDPSTGEYNLKYNMMNLTEDFFLPVRGGDSGTSIENLAGLEWQSIEDIEYLRDKLFASLKIPRAYMTYEEDTSGKALLAAEDIRFARTIERMQKMFVSELTKIALIHLYSLGITDSRLVDFNLSLQKGSTIYEQEKIRIWQEKLRTATDAKDTKMLSEDWIYKNVFNITTAYEIEELRNAVVEDLKRSFRFEQIEQEGNDPAKSGQTVMQGQAIDPFAAGEENEADGKGGIEEPEVDYDDEKFKRGGRPRENQTKYGTDKHFAGRDPLGSKGLNETKRIKLSINSILDDLTTNVE